MDHRGGRLRVVIADDTEDVRALLQYSLELDGRFDVVAQAANGAEAIDVVAAEQPDAVVLDLAMPVMDGLAAIPRLKQVAPDARIVVLSSFGARQMAEQALHLGADNYVEKATFQALTSVLIDLCRSRPPTPPLAAGTETEATPTPVTETVTDTSRLLRLARWIGVVFALLQFAIYQPPPGVHLSFDRLTAAVAVAACLVVANLISMWRPVPILELAIDASVVTGIVWLFGFDRASPVWALLLIPIIEGAMRDELRGALALWALTGVAFIARDIWAPTHFDIPKYTVESITFPLGVLLLVAVTTGHLARTAARTSEQHRKARAESERRAELLALVAGASRKLAALEVDRLLSGVVDAAAAFGFEAVELCTLDPVSSNAWIVAHATGLPERDGAGRIPLDPILVAAVQARQETILIQDGDEGPAPAWRSAGYKAIVATPILAGDAVVATLITATTQAREVSAPEVECLELLATQGAVGLSNVRLLDRIRHQALHDALTGLPNQLLFEDRVAQALTQSSRAGTRVALMFVDLDRFKKINDTLGHDFGNELLRQVAGRLLGAVRAGDTVARMGGDEFTLLLPSLTNDRDTHQVAGKVVEALRAPFAVGDHQLFVTASLGIAVYPTDGARYETLLKHADIAMYRAKALGGNVYEIYGARPGSATDTNGVPRLALEADLHMALLRRELRLVYQPELDLSRGGVVAMEALVRWRHPEFGDIEPADFLPLAEEAGLLGTIDRWVMQNACSRAAQWRRQGATGTRVAVNVSARQLQQHDFADNVLTALAQSGLPSRMLELEVTEGAAVTEVIGVRDALSRLREAGVRVAIDDFGTGYSMLSRLRDFPLDTLKIDRSFIAEIHDRSDEAPIVSATIAMARSLGLAVVAEGVEDDEQLAFVRAAGCDLAQGYLLSRPVEADQVIDLLVEDPGDRAVVLS